MAPFDRSEWLRRARVRLARRAAVSRPAAEEQHAAEYAAILGLEAVVGWAKGRGLSVDFHPKVEAGRYGAEARRVEVSSRITPQKQLVIALHELGHYLIQVSGRAADLFPHGYNRIDEGNPSRDALHKVDVVAEEFDAWRRGWNLARRLGAPIDREYFDTVRSEYLKSYFRWALRRGRVRDT